MIVADPGDPMTSRIAPHDPTMLSGKQTYSYELSADRLQQIRMELLYPFYDQGWCTAYLAVIS